MAYPEKLAKWFIRVTGGKSIAEVYSEERGFHETGLPAEHVHHGSHGEESYCVVHGIEPNRTIGFPLAKVEHVGEGRVLDGTRYAVVFEHGHSMHPDMHQALLQYRGGDKDSFKKMAHTHVERAQRGLPISNYDAGARQYYTKKMERLIQIYVREHPEDPRPEVKPHPRYIKMHWTDIPLGIRVYKEDENG